MKLRVFSILALPLCLHAASDIAITGSVTTGGALTGTNPKTFSATNSGANFQLSTLQGELNAGTGIILDTQSGFNAAGNITLGTNLSKTAGTSSPLVFNAANDLTLSGSISASGGALPLTLNAGHNISNSLSITTNGGNVLLNPTGDFTIGGGLNAGAGTVTLQGGVMRSATSQTVTASNFTVNSGAAVRLWGTVSGPLNVAGSVSPSAPNTAGSLQVNGALTLQAGSTTVIEVGGTSAGSTYDKITASGAVAVAGTLNVDLVNNFHDTITTANSFTILQGSSLSGTFSGLPNGSRYTLPNDRGSFRVTYTATTVVLDDWQPMVTTLTWDPGIAEAGSNVFTNLNTRAGRHFFKVTTQSSDIGGWRTRLNVTSGEAALYFSKTALPTTSSSTFSSAQTGSDGLVLRDDQFAANEEWTVMVFATEGAQWSLVSGKPYVHDLGTLPFTDANSNGQYDIGEVVSAQNAPALPMPPEGVRFYKSSIPTGTPAWSLWLGGSPREIALRSNKLPFTNSTSNYARKQNGQMLIVPPVLGAGTSTWYASVSAPQGEVIGLDSRIQTVSDLAYNATVSNVAVSAAPYRVYRVQVPVDQIAWDINAVAVSGNPDIAVRKGNVPAEFDNEAFSASPGSATEGITLVPNYLTDGVWYITVWGTAPYTFTLKNGDPVITPLSFTDTKLNDQPTRSGWRFYALTDVPSQVGALGWELQLSNQVPGTQIALRRNKVPGRWQKRDGGSTSVTDTSNTYMDDATTNGFLQRVNHQADVWYVGIFLPQQPLGAFSLNVHPITPPTLNAEGSTAITGIEPLKWRYYRMDIPAGMMGWDLRLTNASGGNCALVVRRDQLPFNTGTNNGASSGWSPSSDSTWLSGYQWAGSVDWTGRTYDTPSTPRRAMDDRIIATAGRPLTPGTYYIGIYNDGSDPINNTSNQPANVTLESRGIGSGWAIPINTLAFTPGSQVSVSNLTPREAAYYKVTIPANTPSWEFTFAPTAGEVMLAVRREGIPDILAAASTSIQDTSATVSREMKLQRSGGERYLLLPDNNQTAITPGDYYFALISEGVNPPASNVMGTGSSSGTFTNVGPLAVQDLGAASAAGIVQPVSLAGSQVKAYQFSVPAGTASLELRLDNRVGNPQMCLISGTRVPQPDSFAYDAGVGGGQTSVPAGAVGRSSDDDLMTIANPPAGIYTVTVRADDVAGAWPDASANLAIVANAPAPLAFNGGTASVSNQTATAWRYFQVTVPDGIMGWDLRLTNILSGNPQMVVRRDQLPASTGTNNGSASSWSPPSETAWPSGYQWGGGVDWTGRTYDTAVTPRRAAGDRLVAAFNRPLVAGTYFVGIYNQGTDPITGNANTPAAYSIESRGIGAGQAITINELAFTLGVSFSATDLQPREASYFKVTVPANTPRWDFSLTPSVGEVMLAVRRGGVPDFYTINSGNIQDPSSTTSRQMELQRTGTERYSLLPDNNQDFVTPGDYYFAIISEGSNPPSSTVMGSGPTTSTFTNLGSPAVQDLGTVSLAGVTEPVSLAAAQTKAYRFTVPAGTASLEVRLNNRTGNPILAFMSGTRVPQPDSSAYDYGTGGGQTSTVGGGLPRQTDDDLVTVANPPAGVYTLALRADDISGTYVDATANLVVVAQAPENVPLGGGTVVVSNQGSTAWKYFQVTIPAGIAGWDLRLKDISGGNPSMCVRRDLLPATLGTHNGAGSSWNPSSSTTWPTGHQIAGGKDWTARSYDSTVSNRRAVDDRMVLAMGRPLEPGTYYIGVYNDGSDPVNNTSGQASSYTIESRFIGSGQTIPVATLGFAAGSSAPISSLTPREAAYFKVTVPDNSPSWEFTFAPTSGETMLATRRGFIPDFNVGTSGDLQDDNGRETKVQKAGAERYVLLPLNNQDKVIPGDYYIAVVAEGVNPPTSDVIGTGTSNGTLASSGAIPVGNLGTASLAPINQAVSLAGAQVKGYQFTVPDGVVSLEVQLNNRTGNPRMALISGSRLPYADSSVNEFATSGGQSSAPAGGVARVLADNLITVPNPPAGTYSLSIRADDLSSVYPDATADLVIVARPRTALNFASSQNGNGLSNSDTKQLADGQKQFYEIAVPATLSGQPVLGWMLKLNHAQGDTTLKIYKQWGNPGSGISVTGNTALIVPPFLTFNETWFIEVTATGLTQYTLSSEPVTLARPAWTMPGGHNFTFGDSGNDSAGNPLPGDRGVDIGQDDWHFYAVDVPQGNSGLLRTELKAISGNPNLYIREDGVPTTDHSTSGATGNSLVDRKMEDSGSEYGNWVPFDGRTERQLRPGRWYLGVKASGGSNARYRLIVSTGQVTDLNLASANVTNQTLVGRDWRYYRFTVPADAPATWNLGFTQQVGDVVMWLRDTVPSGQNSGTGTSAIESWSADNKNQGPYDSAGHDAPAVYPFTTAPLRPGHTYYAGFRANSDATFSLTSSSTGSAPAATPVSFYNGVIDTSVPAGGSVFYKIAAPAEATRLKWTSTHPATVQIRVEQGTLPGTTGNQHSNSSGANSSLNQALTPTGWPWQPAQTYYLRIVNSGASAANVLLNIAGQNATTEDEDADGLPDAWEKTYFPSTSSQNGSGDPDGDGVTNAVEFTDGTIPNDINSAKYFLTVNANFGSVTKSPNQPKYDRGTSVTLSATPNAGLVFTGWTGSASGTVNPLQFAITADKNITANFGVSLPVALDSALNFTTGGDGIWMGQVVTTMDGVDAAQSGPIGHNQQSWMETTVSGPGEMGFAWKVSSQAGDYLEFYIDGVLKAGRITGEVDWTLKSYAVDFGQHVLRWRYVKNGSGVAGADTAWVDAVNWMPAGGYDQWLSDHFTEQEIADIAIVGQDADPDHDGLANLLEYAFGTEPREGAEDMALARVTPEVVKVNGKDRLRLRFTLPESMPADILYEVEVSNDLVNWTVISDQQGGAAWNGNASTSVSSPVNGRCEHVITDDASLPPQGKRFGRVRVTLQ